MQAREGLTTAAVLAVLLFGYQLGRAQLPEEARLPLNLAVAALLLVGWAMRRGAAWSEVGLEPARLPQLRGLAWGMATMTLVGIFVTAAAAVPSTQGNLRPDEAVSAGAAAYKLLVNIPFQTVVFEEVVFRGVLLALLLRATGVVRAVLLSSVLFGFWHVVPTIENAANGVSVGEVAGTVVFTAVAGALFAGLRLLSGSLLAPALMHLATNGFLYLAGYLLGPA